MLIVDPFSGGRQFLPGYRKPGFKYQSDYSVVVPASSTRPAHFIIGKSAYRMTSDLECNLTTNGLGGIASGETLAANTPYYLYAVRTEDTIKLVADTNDPETGPRDSSEWTYLGAFPVFSSTTVPHFISNGGRLILNNYDSSVGPVNTTTTTAETFTYLPVTAKALDMQVAVTSNTQNDIGFVSGIDSTTVSCSMQRCPAASGINYLRAMVPVFVEKTVYLFVSNVRASVYTVPYGWLEDPSEYA